MVAPLSSVDDAVDWAQLLQQSRAGRNDLVLSDEEADDIYYLQQFRSVKDVIRQQLILSTKESSRHRIRVRLALRVALSYLSVPPETMIRPILQKEAFEAWHNVLLKLLSLNQSQDPKCLLIAAQVLCNAVTDCPHTAQQLLKVLPTAPTQKSIAAKLRHSAPSHPNESWTTSDGNDVGEPSPQPVAKDDDDDDDGCCFDEALWSTNTTAASVPDDANWVDLLLVCATHRPALSAMVACLHNCLCAAENEMAAVADDCANTSSSSMRQVASCPLLVATLLRHIVTAKGVQQAATTSNDQDGTDDATEWITLTIFKLCRVGLLPQMYQAIYANLDGPVVVVLPEHIVLLHSVRNCVESDAHSTDEATTRIAVTDTCKARCYALGGEGNNNDNGAHNSVIDTHLYLARLYLALRNEKEINTGLSSLSSLDGDDDGLRVSALQLTLDILAETLAEDSHTASRIRERLGIETTFLQALVWDLATVLDAWHVQNEGRGAREHTKMTDIDQCRVTSTVRVLGNLCFQCRRNQDLMRLTAVPRHGSFNHSGTGGDDNNPMQAQFADRNGLHVLLSTTSMSYTCFTLREWAVVAIRTALENCPENQDVVARLEAGKAVQSTTLEDMGIRINLDKGRVSIAPLRDPHEIV